MTSTPQRPHEDSTTVVFLVHGTFAGAPSQEQNDEPKKWWEPGSTWANTLEDTLAKQNLSVECRQLQWPDREIGPGPNLETDRRRGGKTLFNELRNFEERNPDRPYHIVAHSHGGSVVWHALVAAAARGHGLHNLKSWTTVGTPFLTFRPALMEFLNPAIALGVMLGLLLLWLSQFYAHAPEGFGEMLEIAGFLAEPLPGKEPVKLLDLLSQGRMVPLTAMLCGLGGVFAFTYVATRFLLEKLLQRIQFTLSETGIVRKLVSTVIAVVMVSLSAAFVGGNANAMAMPLVIAALLLNLAVAVWVTVRLFEMARLWRENAWRKKYERKAAEQFGPLWRGLVHPSDEAVALLSASLMRAPPIRPTQRSGNEKETGFSLDSVKQPLVDQATWRALSQYAMGDDRDGLTSARCSRSPFPVEWNCTRPDGGLFQMKADVAANLAGNANDSVRQMAVALRERLKLLSTSKTDQPEQSLMAKLSFSGLIHTSYFRLPEKDASAAEPADHPAGGSAQHLILKQIAAWIAKPPRQPERDKAMSARALEFQTSPPPEKFLLHQPGPAVDLLDCNPERPLERALREKTLRERFRNLETVSLLAAVVMGAVSAFVLIVPTEIWIKPLTRASHQIAAREAPFDDPLTLRTGDAPVAAAYALRLAALGELDDDRKIYTFLRNINQPNARAAVTQRLAFAFAVRAEVDAAGEKQKTDLANAVVAHARGPSTRSSSILIERLQSLTQLSASAGHVMAGMRWTKQNPAVFDNAKRAWNERRNEYPKVSVHTCEDADTQAAAALYLPVRIRELLNRGTWDEFVWPLTAEMLAVASYISTFCTHSNVAITKDDGKPRARAWVVATFIEVAQMAHSWGQSDIAKAALEAAGLVYLVAGHTNINRSPGPASIAHVLRSGEDVILNQCVTLVRSFDHRHSLGYTAESRPAGCDAGKPESQCARLTDACASKRNALLKKLTESDCSETPGKTDAFSCARRPLKYISEYKGVIEECRSEPNIATGHVRAQYEEALKVCGAVGEHSALAATAAILMTDLFGDPGIAAPLFEKITNEAHFDSRLRHLLARGVPLLTPHRRNEVHIAAIRRGLNDLLHSSDAGVDFATSPDRALRMRKRHLEITLAKGLAPGAAVNLADDVVRELNDDPSRLYPEEAIAGIGAILAAAPAQIVMRDVHDVLPVAASDVLSGPPVRLLQDIAAQDSILPNPPLHPQGMIEPFRMAQRIAELLIAGPTSDKGHPVSGRFLALDKAPILMRLVHRLADEDRDNVNAAALALEKIPSLDPRNREIVQYVLRGHTQEVAGRDLIVRRLAPIVGLHAANRDFNRAAVVIRASGDRSLNAAFNCRVLDDLIDQRDSESSGRKPYLRARYGLLEDRRWPQLAPVRFGQGPRFAFPEPQGGGVPCRVTRDYNVAD